LGISVNYIVLRKTINNIIALGVTK
jgi:hypothetical protein